MKIDLKRKPETSEPKPTETSSDSYPCVYLSDIEDIADIPAEGMAQVHYKVVSKTMTERGGKKRFNCELEIRSIEPTGKVKSQPKEKEDPDKIFSKLDKKESYE